MALLGCEPSTCRLILLLLLRTNDHVMLLATIYGGTVAVQSQMM